MEEDQIRASADRPGTWRSLVNRRRPLASPGSVVQPAGDFSGHLGQRHVRPEPVGHCTIEFITVEVYRFNERAISSILTGIQTGPASLELPPNIPVPTRPGRYWDLYSSSRHVKPEWIFQVISRQRAKCREARKLVLVEHVGEALAQLLLAEDRTAGAVPLYPMNPSSVGATWEKTPGMGGAFAEKARPSPSASGNARRRGLEHR